MDVIEFKYQLTDGMMQIGNEVDGLPRVLRCYLPKEHANLLQYTSLYLVAKHSYTPEDDRHAESHTYSMPLGIVARRESEAVSIYNTITGSDDSTSFAELVRDCTKMEVV